MKTVILNTGCANLSSIKFSIEKLGYNIKISNDLKNISNADKIFLPGVGTAKSAMHQLKKYNLVELINTSKKPIFGICLGMQLFGKNSKENNGTNTLNIINETIRKIKNHNLPIPHMGWNKVNFIYRHDLFKNIKNKSYFYFTHSYIMPINEFTLASSKYGEKFTAILQKDNFFGVQFHPERSGDVGLQLLKNFLEI